MERLSILQEVSRYNNLCALIASLKERILKGNLGPLCGLNGKWRGVCAQHPVTTSALLNHHPSTAGPYWDPSAPQTVSYARGEDQPFISPRVIEFIYPRRSALLILPPQVITIPLLSAYQSVLLHFKRSVVLQQLRTESHFGRYLQRVNVIVLESSVFNTWRMLRTCILLTFNGPEEEWASDLRTGLFLLDCVKILTRRKRVLYYSEESLKGGSFQRATERDPFTILCVW